MSRVCFLAPRQTAARTAASVSSPFGTVTACSRRTRRSRAVIALALSLATIDTASAQMPVPPDPESVPVLVGPLWITPRLTLGNAGVDTNVFNQPDTEGPQQDFTITVTPSAEAWLRMGPSWLTGTVREDIVWFKEFVSERSVNNTLRVGWLLPLSRIAVHLGTGWMHTRERPGFEVDARVQRQERELNGAVELRALSRTRLGVRGERRRVEFEDGAVFLGTDLRDQLTRTTTAAGVTVRHELTPLTTLLVSLAREQDRFEFSSLRNSETNRAEIGLEFDPAALISGTARIGVREFDPTAADLAGYSGTTASMNVSYIAAGSTRLTVQAVRDIEYSFDVTQPYYLQSGVAATVAQQIYGPIDAEARIGAQQLEYRTRGLEPALSERVDRVRSYGGGVGYHVGRDLRVGFNVDRQRRRSDVGFRTYEGMRYGLSVSYGR
jgi:hypothetical protein